VRQTRHTFCRICESLCGLEVTLEGGEIVRIRPDEQHVATRGFACVKGLKQHRLYGSPDRLRTPLARVGGEWHRISWDRALAEIGEKVSGLREQCGPDSIAMYVGTAAGFGVLHPIFAQGFMTGLGSRSMYSSATQDCSNKFAVARSMYGFPFTQPFPDIEHCECLIVVGANPLVSEWSFGQVPNPSRSLKAIEARGGRVFFVDPRRTESAKVAGEHVFIRPDTDVFFYLSFLNELIASGGVDREQVDRHMTGLEQIERLAEPWSPERCESVTRIPAARLREMVAAYRQASGAALYCSTGVNMGTNGSLAFWVQEAINAISGNLDRRGGTLVGRGIVDFARFCVKNGVLMSSQESRIGGFRSVNDGFPGGILPDEILTPGPRQVRSLFVTGGNPLLTMANSARLREALQQLELLVVTDIFLNETASLAHYVLPATTPLERPDLPFLFPLFLGLQARPYLQATEAVLEPDGEQRDEATIYLDLARACGVSLFGSRVAQRIMELGAWVHSARRGGRREIPQRALLSTLLRVARAGSFEKLLASPHGVVRPPHGENDFLGERIVTEDRKLRLAPEELVEAASKLEADFGQELSLRERFKLITMRHLMTQNSWTHNLEDFVSGDRQTNYLYMHPEDARRVGLRERELADVSSETATVRVPVKLLDDLMPGTVALPHGWGHQQAAGLEVASKTTGVNANLLAADGPDRLERFSGMAQLTGILVEVQPARGPQEPTSWSGIGEEGEVPADSRL
jgi:formate dehydrogenase